MKTETNWAAASALAAIFSLASMPAYAQSIFVSAESGKLVPIDGAWEFPGCSKPDDEDDPQEQFDNREFLIFDGNTVESRIIFYETETGICTGAETVVTEGPFPISATGEIEARGWGLVEEDDYGNLIEVFELEPPLRQDFSDTLNVRPTVTRTEIVVPVNGSETETEIEIGYAYIDDTGEKWFLYREEGGNEPFDIVMSPYEPLRQIDLEPKPECEIELSQDTYVDGDTIMASVFRLSNPTAERVALEVKVWLGKPNESVKSIVNIGAYGFFRVLPETDIDLGPLWLGWVGPRKARGEYELSCRVLDPRTGKRIAENINHFTIE